MIDVKLLEMTADKSRYFVDRDVMEALLDRLEAAERERDNRRGAYDVISEGYQRVTMENAALAAHVEQVREAANIVLKNSWSLEHQALNDALADDVPENSLARRDAVTRRDEVESLLSVIGAYPDRAALLGMLRERSDELRRQAEQNAKE